MDNEYSLEEQQKYDRGFNYGNMFAKYDPSLVKDLVEIVSDDPFLRGVHAGKKDFDREKRIRDVENLPEWFKKDITTKAFNEKSRDPEIDEDRG